MISLVYCDNCGKSGSFKIHLEVTYHVNNCTSCHQHRNSTWRYYFCDMDCHADWMIENDIHVQGVICKDCTNINGIPTGFTAGYESNGTCRTCAGTMRVKV